MQRLEVSGAVRPIYGSLGVKQLIEITTRERTLPRQEQNPGPAEYETKNDRCSSLFKLLSIFLKILFSNIQKRF